MALLTDQMLAEPEAAEFLGLRRQTLAAWRCAGRGPAFVKIGRAIRYRMSVLQKYVERHSCTNTQQAARLEPAGV